MPLSSQPLPDNPSARVVKAAIALRQKLLSLVSSLAPPELQIFEIMTGMGRAQAVHLAAEWSIPDLLDEYGPLDAAALAARLGTDADAMHRMMRGAATFGLFTLLSDGRFENNRLSSALLSRRENSARSAALYWGSRSNVDAWRDLGNTLRTGKDAYVRNLGMNVWDWFDAHPEERDAFADMMGNLTRQAAPTVATIYPDWGRVRTVCDVAGGRGVLLSELLVRNPSLRGMLFDNPGVIALAPPLFAARGVAARATTHAGSFFLPEIPTGADTYLLKNILHDWDDARCVHILQNVRKACQPGTRLLVAELLLEKNETSFAALSDVHMMAVCEGGRERSRAELARLMRDGGFTQTRVFEHPIVSLIEGLAS